MTTLSPTDRIFTLVLRTIDATITSSPGITQLQWPVNWTQHIPPDIRVGSKFRVTYSFDESSAMSINSGRCDTLMMLRRGHPIYCNIANSSICTDSTSDIFPNVISYGKTKSKYIGNMYGIIPDDFTTPSVPLESSAAWFRGNPVHRYAVDPCYFEANGLLKRNNIMITYTEDIADTHYMYGPRDACPCFAMADYLPGGAHFDHFRVKNSGLNLDVIANQPLDTNKPTPMWATVVQGPDPALMYSYPPPLGSHVFEFQLMK